MERRKSLIALPLNPSPGCYNLPSSLLPHPLPIVNPSPPPPLFSRVLQAAFPLASCVPALLHTDSSAALQLSAVPPSLLRLTKKHCTSARQKPHNLEPFDRVSKPTSPLNKLKVCWGRGRGRCILEVYARGNLVQTHPELPVTVLHDQRWKRLPNVFFFFLQVGF